MTTSPGGGAIISTGSNEIDKKMGGGIPVGSLVLLEGQSDAGKSVLCQHFTHGALSSLMSSVYYTTENTVKSLVSQMSSLNLDITDYFLCDRMRIYPLDIASSDEGSAGQSFQVLIDHLDSLPTRFNLAIIRANNRSSGNPATPYLSVLLFPTVN